MKKWRHTFIIFLFTSFYLILIVSLYNIQFNKRPFYSARVATQSLVSGVLEPQRGNIYFTDKNNNLILAALNSDYNVVYSIPKDVQKNIESGNSSLEEYGKILNDILGISEEEIIQKLGKKGSSYALLLQKASGDQVSAIRELKLEGIFITKQKLRYYPFGGLGAHLLGYVSSATEKEFSKYGDVQMGRYGLEYQFNESLAGIPGSIDGNKIIDPENGQDLKTTIDRNIQFQVEEIMEKLIKDWGAEGGTAIVQEPKSGKILAMASFPNFDPNNFSQSEIKNFLNPATQAIYEPGSVFKLITMAIGIDSGKITSSTTYYDSGSVTLNGKTIKNWDLKAYGKQTMTSVIEHSLNTGTVFAEKQIGHNIFYNYLEKFGISELTGINLPSEVRGKMGNLKKGKDVDFATASFGQGIAVTPIRLINAISVIANDGVLMKPLILSEEKPEVVERVISKEAANDVTGMMVSAVEKNVVAKVPNYKIAGKTGTAFVPDFGKGGYTDDVINTYVGFAPASDPAFVILIKLDKPAGSPLAGQTVVPAFRELTQFILNYYNIAPDGVVTGD